MSRAPYQGVTFLELADGVACAYAGMLLADRGARVILLEPPAGHPLRHRPSPGAGSAKRFAWLARGKESLGWDDDSAQAMTVLERLLGRVDVLLTDRAESWFAARGLPLDELLHRFPQLRIARNSAFGARGPLADLPPRDLLLQARSGLLAGEAKLAGDGVTPLPLCSTAMTAYPTGILLALGVGTMQLSGERQVSVSEYAVALAVSAVRTTDNAAADRLRNLAKQKLAAARARGADHALLRAARADLAVPPGNVFYRAFRTRDGAVFVGALSRPLRDKVRRVLGIDYGYPDDPTFDPADPARRAECVAMEAAVEAQFRAETSATWVARFDAAGVPVGEVIFPEDASALPQVLANGDVVAVDGDASELQVAHPARFGGWAMPPPRPAPAPPTIAAPDWVDDWIADPAR